MVTTGGAPEQSAARTGPAEAVRRLLLVLTALVLTAGGALTALPAYADEAPKVLLLLDVSGSMNEKISSGGTKFAAAKKALKSVAASLPPGTQVGLRVYGSEISEPKSRDPKACTDTRLVLPIGPLDRSTMDAAVDSFSPKGETPIAYSLGKAVDDLGDDGKRVLILVSDGQETCSGDPCPTARKLADRGVDLQFNAIGLAVNGKARSQLRCIAKAGGGSYYDAGDTDTLDRALRKLTQRALRPFEATGTRVTGTADPGTAPPVGVGQYLDKVPSGNKPRYYTINRTPGSDVTATADSVVRDFGETRPERLDLVLSTLSGQKCSNASIYSVVENADVVLSAAVRSSHSQGVPQPPEGCAQDPQLRLALTRDTLNGTGGTVPVELLVGEQPQVLNRDALPENVASYDGKGAKVAKTSPVSDVVGGSGFSNAAELTPGSWSDSMAFGETVLYRARLDYGQRLRVTATVPAANRAGLTYYDLWLTRLYLYTPSRVKAAAVQSTTRGNQKPVSLTLAGPEVRVRNDELALPPVQNDVTRADASTASVAGDYYVILQLQPQGEEIKGVDVPVRLDVAIDGTANGQPQFASAPPSETPSTTPSSGPTSSPSTAPTGSGPSTLGAALIGLGVGLLVAAGAVTAVVVRRRNRRQRAG